MLYNILKILNILKIFKTVCDVISFRINLNLLIKPFFYTTKKS